MRTRARTAPTQKNPQHQRHGHGRAHCLKILKQLSAYLDDELPREICEEIRRHLGACPNCEEFVKSLRQTITLCRHHPVQPLSPTAKVRLRRQILKVAASLRYRA